MVEENEDIGGERIQGAGFDIQRGTPLPPGSKRLRTMDDIIEETAQSSQRVRQVQEGGVNPLDGLAGQASRTGQGRPPIGDWVKNYYDVANEQLDENADAFLDDETGEKQAKLLRLTARRRIEFDSTSQPPGIHEPVVPPQTGENANPFLSEGVGKEGHRLASPSPEGFLDVADPRNQQRLMEEAEKIRVRKAAPDGQSSGADALINPANRDPKIADRFFEKVGPKRSQSRSAQPQSEIDGYFGQIPVSPGSSYLDKLLRAAGQAESFGEMMQGLKPGNNDFGRFGSQQWSQSQIDEGMAGMEDWKHYGRALSRISTKRLIVDGRQATKFGETDSRPPAHWLSYMRPPFDDFYVEFSEPILIGPQEPMIDDQIYGTAQVRNGMDRLKAMLFVTGLSPDKGGDLAANVSFFLEDDGGHMTDRSFIWSRSQGALTRLMNCSNPGALDDSEFPPGVDPAQWVVISQEQEFAFTPEFIEEYEKNPDLYPDELFKRRYRGWWEQVLTSYQSLVDWLLVYTMAKGIEIVVKSRSRAERRREEKAEKKGFIPNPWHVVRVEPTLTREVEGGGGGGSGHSYRYDVMGHARFLSDGRVVWVRPHQRGLANELYIPKTSKFEGTLDGKIMPRSIDEVVDR